MSTLPIDAQLSSVVRALSARRCAVVVAPPGAGKTTRVPPAILKAGLLTPDSPALILLQPRRVAARAAAARIAEENGWTLGEEVGYQVRFDRRARASTRLLVATEGILTRRLVDDPFLDGVGAVVLDEFHERSLHTDLVLALLREVRETVRDDLIVVVMSATLEAEPIAEYLGGCPVIRAEGRRFPVAIQHLPASSTPLHVRVARAVQEGLSAPRTESSAGDILVFLPGWEEIRRTTRELKSLAEREDLLILPLHGSLSPDDQDRVLRPADRRKVILSTNVAETSLTIDGVRTVIDSGLARYASYDPRRGLDRLTLGRISRASAEQRAGRAGRTGPGRCLRLWTAREDRGLAPFDQPEVRRADLCETVLALHAWGHADLSTFPWFEAPPPESLAAAERLLAMLGALESEGGSITPLGRQLLRMPIHPRLGRLLVASAEGGTLEEGAALAALMSEKDLLRLDDEGGHPPPEPVRGESDLLIRLDRLAEAEHSRFAPHLRARGIDPSAARQVARARDELIRIGRRLGLARAPGRGGPADEESLLKLVLLAYPDRVTRRRGEDGSTGVMVGGRGIRLDPRSVVRDADLFLSLDPREERRGAKLEARVRIASAVRMDWLEACFPGSIRRERVVHFEEDRQSAVAIQTIWYRDLLLREERSAVADRGEAEAALLNAVAARAEELVQADDAASAWLARLEFLKRALPEESWPTFDASRLAEILCQACVGKRTLAEVRAMPLVPRLKAALTSAQIRLLDTQAPEALEVPSGSRVRVTYPAEGPPVLSVRLQELFGWHETPRLASGRVRVLLHLLGPNYRPVQITDDLRSFWSTTYFQVRKDLRARYPRHAWPEDPLTARPEAKGGRRH